MSRLLLPPDEIAEPPGKPGHSYSAASFGGCTGPVATDNQVSYSEARGRYAPAPHYDLYEEFLEVSEQPFDMAQYSQALPDNETHGSTAGESKDDDDSNDDQPDQPNQSEPHNQSEEHEPEQQSVSVVPTTSTCHHPSLTARKRAKANVFNDHISSDCQPPLLKFLKCKDKSERDLAVRETIKEIEKTTRQMQNAAKCDQRIGTGPSAQNPTFKPIAWGDRRVSQVCDYLYEMNAHNRMIMTEEQYTLAAILCQSAAYQVAKMEIATPGSTKSLKTGSAPLWAIIIAQEVRARATEGHNVKQSAEVSLHNAQRTAREISFDGMVDFIQSLKGQRVSRQDAHNSHHADKKVATRIFDSFIPGTYEANEKKIRCLKWLLEQAGDKESIREDICQMKQPFVYQFRSVFQTGLYGSASTSRSPVAGFSAAGSPLAVPAGDMTNAANRKSRVQKHKFWGRV